MKEKDWVKDGDKKCKVCETPITRETTPNFRTKQFCSRKCMGMSYRGRMAKSVKLITDWSTYHKRARKICVIGPCVDCGDVNPRDVHHIDGNHKNNTSKNLVRICRSCHLKRHRKWTPCKTCGKKSDRNGYCPQHWYSWKTYGDPLQTERNGHKNFGGRKCSQKNSNGATYSDPSTSE